MGLGIFTKYSKQVIGGLVAFFLLLAAIPCYYWFRDPIGGVSPYTEVNDFFEQEKISFAVAEKVHSTDVKTQQKLLQKQLLLQEFYLPAKLLQPMELMKMRFVLVLGQD